MEFVSPEGLRLDGRKPLEMRHMRFEIGTLKGPDGSAYVEMGNTKVAAVVYGPHEVKNRRDALLDTALVRCEYSMAAFSTGGERRRRGKGDRRSQEISLVIKQTLEAAILGHLMPRTQIDVFVQVLQADGGTRSACINAASLALAHAGIPLRDLVTSCAAGFLDGTVLLDLNYLEDSGGGPDVTIALLPTEKKISLLQMDARLQADLFERVLEEGMKGCQKVADLMREELARHTQDLVVAQGTLQL
eukprot:TRINITY_DN2799_c0_g1_i1.p1 TRINITY_DN2799_c0_g1~~TRINITY_DN2799_c0_g1_i1.p1  ORF type:complete len:246 (+),score=54.49 TRINITY_DN2799_c0_g1_i1:431-1168(+)